MSGWKLSIECPKCGSDNVRFIEPHYEMSVYECEICHCRFEVEEEAE